MLYTYHKDKNKNNNQLISKIMPRRGGDQGGQETNRSTRRRGTSREENYEKNEGTRGGASKDDEEDESDPWNQIANMKGGSDEGEFTKMNTNFFLRDNEEAEVLFLDEDPVIFMGHSLKGISDSNTTFYRTEACQKTEQDYCVMCDSRNGNVGKQRRVIGFRLIDFRGKWDSNKGGFDGVPAPKIFLVPLYLAKQIKILKDDTGSLTDKVAKLTKSGNYGVNFVTVTRKGGGFDYDYIDFDDEFEDMSLPEISEVYAPLEDGEIDDFIDRFCSSAPATPTRSSGSARGGSSRGSLTEGSRGSSRGGSSRGGSNRRGR